MSTNHTARKGASPVALSPTSKACLSVALRLLKLGFSPLPPVEDGSKRPTADIPVDEDGKTGWTWKPYQSTPATEEHVRRWYKHGRTGVGVAGGVGGLDPFEFDCYDTYERYLSAAAAVGLGDLVERVKEGYEELTPSGGVHWLFACAEPGPSTKLARRFKTSEEFTEDDHKAIEAAEAQGKEHRPVKTLIETKGRGGFIILAPSNGRVHPSGGQYQLRQGGLDSIVTLTVEERDQLWHLARTLDEIPSEPAKRPKAKPKANRNAPTDNSRRPGDDYNERMTWADILEPYGWTLVHTSGDVEYWRRPGKKESWSASVGYCKGLHVFTSSTTFKQGENYSKFAAYTHLEHKGDWDSATKALAAAGYGTWIDKDGEERPNPRPTRETQPATAEPSPNGRPLPTRGSGFACTDMGNAERLVARHGSKLRYCHPWGKWLVYDGRRWEVDATAEVERLAKETVRSIYLEVSQTDDLELRKALAAHAIKSEKRERVNAMVALAQSEPGIPILPDQLDTDAGVFNFSNGTLELRTGVLRSHRKEDLISKLCDCDYDTDAKCPNYDATLELFLGGSADLIGYVDRISGCAMHGAVRDHILPIAYGTGSNGKSTILGAWLDAFGPDYAMKAPISLLVAKKGDCHPTERMDLYRKRLVVAIETADGAKLNEVMVKELTGGDRIRGRRLYEDDWEFSPTHTIVMATNHRPEVKGTDKGIWRRLKEVPFTVSVDTDKADLDMPEKLRAERAGIMARCSRGCRDYFASGLREPQAVTEATAEYRSEQDQIGRFMDEHITRVAGARARCGDVYSRYKAWAEACGETALTLTSFGKRIAEMGIEKTKNKPKWYLGIGLCSGDGDDKAF
jgi:putative DNA primase/helicase